MRRRRVFFLVAAALLSGTLLLLFVFCEDEPHHDGKPLSTWIGRYRDAKLYDHPAAASEAETAIKTIGTNALPYLLKWLPYRESKAHKRRVDALRALPPILTGNRVGEWLATDRKETRSLIAMFGFQPLGAEAKSAIPELARLMTLTDREDDQTARSAVYALTSLGDAGVPTLVAGLTNCPAFRRILIIEFLGDERFPGQNRPARVSALVKCLEDENSFVVRQAAISLGHLRTDPDLVVPALERAIGKPGADVAPEVVEVLGQFRGQTRPAALTNTLSR
jgi:hypothetical protein